jgi:hypothetical protein
MIMNLDAKELVFKDWNQQQLNVFLKMTNVLC